MKKRFGQIASTLTLVCLVTAAAMAQSTAPAGQAPPAAERQKQGFVWLESFEGSSNADGQVMRLGNTVGYNFNRHFGVDMGLPVYFIRPSSSTNSTQNGIGDYFTDARFTFNNPIVNFRTTLTGTAPTGDASKGLGTGRATFDWTSHFDRGFGRFTPFLDLGLANSISDTRFFRRPFITLGPLAHFEAGADFDLFGPVSIGASAYDVRPWGTQRVFSRVRGPGPSSPGPTRRGRIFETSGESVGTSDLDRDNGFSTWVDISLNHFLSLDAGYTRSVRFALDTVSFGLTLNLSSLVNHGGSSRR